MNIAIVGTGYVGLVSGSCLADMGAQVSCVDIDQQKIENLNKGIIPIYEPGLEEVVARNVEAGRLQFTTDLTSVLDDVDIVFIAVGTPPGDDGSADLRFVKEVASTIGRHMNNYVLLVTKSTVPVGTAAMMKQIIHGELDKRRVDIPYDVASNPEFLKEGDAINDFMRPDRVVIGVESDRAKELLTRLYRPLMLNNFRVIFMDIPSAEMTKYAANAMLATRISFMNDIANLCELLGANVNMVRKGIAADQRIGSKFLYPGCGYGGSCFPKDVKAIINTAEQVGYEMKVLKAVEEVNTYQKTILFEKLNQYYNSDLQGKTIALWGLSFKPNTDDMREATSLVLIELILKAGAKVRVFDPVAMEEAKIAVMRNLSYLPMENIVFANDMYDAVLDADALLLVTEWKEFRMPAWAVVKRSMKHAYLIDGRNIYDLKELKEVGFDYEAIGMKIVVSG
ncbi:MAG: UDP-glucose/GDP-mannose dehydrogenase family protein [Paludibacter sp.]|nr:UDP-glucose/GDP-mannose dehydrogenase family protein [Paludibacter sp.]MDD4428494.1 UDP-glucose/GDP-mannose dehydrogenase family protein [Paludibacter sp.]